VDEHDSNVTKPERLIAAPPHPAAWKVNDGACAITGKFAGRVHMSESPTMFSPPEGTMSAPVLAQTRVRATRPVP
jgi:hypothetical protein